MIDHIKNILWTHMGIVRNEVGISKALNEIASIKMSFNEIKSTSNLSDYYQLRNAISLLKPLQYQRLKEKSQEALIYQK